MGSILSFLGQYSPQLLVGVGVALLIVPKWIRVVLAAGLIFVGLTNMGVIPNFIDGTNIETGGTDL